MNWTVVCVSEEHPKGGNDWARLVRKHAGFHGVDDAGDVVDGVAHIDPVFSPYAPPPTVEFPAINARMLARAAARHQIRDRWRVGEPYRDRVAVTLRVRPTTATLPGRAEAAGVSRLMLQPARLVLHETGVEVRDPGVVPPQALSWRDTAAALTTAAVHGAAAAPATSAVYGWLGAASLGVGLGVAGLGVAAVRSRRRARDRLLKAGVVDQVRQAAAVPSVGQLAAALAAAGLTRGDASAVVVEVHPGAEHRCRLDGCEADTAVFAAALDEALAPIATPRYVVSRHTVTGTPILAEGLTLRTAKDALVALQSMRPDAVTWHPGPAPLGVNASRARHFQAAWERWVGPGRLLFTGSPEGAGVLAAQQGADPFSATTVLRRHWL